MTALTLADVDEQLAKHAALTDPTVSGPPASDTGIAATIAAMRANQQRESEQLESFVEMAAEVFRCPSLVCDHARLALHTSFLELRNLSIQLNEQAARRGAPLGQPVPVVTGRDAQGRFVGRG
jgi:hypothetical protein